MLHGTGLKRQFKVSGFIKRTFEKLSQRTKLSTIYRFTVLVEEGLRWPIKHATVTWAARQAERQVVFDGIFGDFEVRTRTQLSRKECSNTSQNQLHHTLPGGGSSSHAWGSARTAFTNEIYQSTLSAEGLLVQRTDQGFPAEALPRTEMQTLCLCGQTLEVVYLLNARLQGPAECSQAGSVH